LAKHMRIVWSLVVASVILDLALFTVWVFAFAGFPWFIYLFASTGALCGSLFLLSQSVPNQLLKLHLLLSVIINFTVLHTYVFAYTQQPYFAYVLIPSGALLVLHLFLVDYWGPISRPHKLFYIHLFCIYIPLNAILFVAFISSSPSFAWFAFPLWATSVLPLAHYILAFHQDSPHKWFYVDLAIIGNLAGLVFLISYVTSPYLPWFIYAWSIMGIVIGVHYAYDFHPSTIKRLASSSLVKVGGLRQKISAMRLPGFGGKKETEPDVVTPEAANGTGMAEAQQVPSQPSQV